MKQIIKLTESNLYHLIKESVTEYFTEDAISAFMKWIDALKTGKSDRELAKFEEYAMMCYGNSKGAEGAVQRGLNSFNQRKGPDNIYADATKFVFVPLPKDSKDRNMINAQLQQDQRTEGIDVRYNGTIIIPYQELLYKTSDIQRTPDGGFADDGNGNFVVKPGKILNYVKQKQIHTMYGNIDMARFSPKPGMSGNEWNRLTDEYLQNYRDNDSISRTDKDTGLSFERQKLNVDNIPTNLVYSSFLRDNDVEYNYSEVRDRVLSDVLKTNINTKQQAIYLYDLLNKSLFFFSSRFVYSDSHKKDLLSNYQRVPRDFSRPQKNDSWSDDIVYNENGEWENGEIPDTPMEQEDSNSLQSYLDCLKWLRSKNKNGQYNIYRYMGQSNPAYVDIINALITTIKNARSTVAASRNNFNMGRISYTYYQQMCDQGLLNGKQLTLETYKTYVNKIIHAISADGYNNQVMTDFNSYQDKLGEARRRRYINRIINETINQVLKNMIY